jgi:hypothetical protein
MMLRLTDPGFHVTQFAESFIVVRLRLVLQCFAIVDELVIPPNPATPTAQLVKYLFDNQYIFVGYKGSNQAIHDYQLWHRNLQIPDTLQSNSVYEHFLYDVYKSKGDLDNKKFVYTPY